MSSYRVILLLLVTLGAGISANQAPGAKAIVSWFSSRGRATAMGIKQTGVTAGGMLGSLFLPLIGSVTQSWRYPCAVAGVISLTTAMPMLIVYHDPQRENLQKLACGGSYVDDLRRLCNWGFLFVCMAVALLMAVQFAFCAYFVLFASTVLGLPLTKCGTLLAISFGAGAVGRVGWSVVSDYLFGGRRNGVLVYVSLVCALVCIWLGSLSAGARLTFVYIAAIIFGLTGLGWTALYLTLVGEMHRKELAGTAIAATFVLGNIGAVLGPPLFGSLVDLTHGYRIPWYFLASCTGMVVLLNAVQQKRGMSQGGEVEHS